MIGGTIDAERLYQMQSDTIKLLFTYTIATIIIIGGGLILYDTRNDANGQNLNLVVAGFIGAAVTFTFNRESATQATRAAQSSAQQTSAQNRIDSNGNGDSVPH